MPTIQIDIVHVNKQERPVYNDVYPTQTIPRMAREIPEDKQAAEDPQRFEAGD